MEIGEYIRTQNGRIGRVIKIWVWEGTSKRKEQTHYLIDWGGKASYIAILKNLKHSKNLIDLIENGDYVNGYRVKSIEEDGDIMIEIPFENNNGYRLIEDIKSVVTKEQFENIKYEVN